MSIVPQITNCRQYIPQNAKSPEKSELLRAVKMWYSSTRSHVGQQTHTDIRFSWRFTHGRRLLCHFNKGIITRKSPCVDSHMGIAAKYWNCPSKTNPPKPNLRGLMTITVLSAQIPPAFGRGYLRKRKEIFLSKRTHIVVRLIFQAPGSIPKCRSPQWICRWKPQHGQVRMISAKVTWHLQSTGTAHRSVPLRRGPPQLRLPHPLYGFPWWQPS